jgi:Ricin-type beta-trefoil lectin domain-like
MTHQRKYTFRPDCEGLEGRQLLSTSIENVYSGKVLDDKGASKSDGTAIIQYHWHGGLNQQWNLVPLPNGVYEIQNVYSGKVLDDKGASASNGNPIIQYHWHGGLNQEWRLIPVGDGAYEIQNVWSGKVLDDTGYSTSDGTAIIQYHWHGGLNQEWELGGTLNESTNFDWARWVLHDLNAPESSNNITVITQWMDSEEPVNDWWDRNNPLNNGLGSGGGAGLGSYPTLSVAALYVAKNLEGESYDRAYGYTAIVADLKASAAPSTTARAIEDSSWAASHYGYGSAWHSGPVATVAAPSSAW